MPTTRALKSEWSLHNLIMPYSTRTFKLVLKFEAHAVEDYDQLVSLEDCLIETLQPEAKVEGHDMGKGEFNIFILTGIPTEIFEQAKSLIIERCPNRMFKAAYRALNAERYEVVWPPGLQHFEVS